MILSRLGADTAATRVTLKMARCISESLRSFTPVRHAVELVSRFISGGAMIIKLLSWRIIFDAVISVLDSALYACHALRRLTAIRPEYTAAVTFTVTEPSPAARLRINALKRASLYARLNATFRLAAENGIFSLGDA